MDRHLLTAIVSIVAVVVTGIVSIIVVIVVETRPEPVCHAPTEDSVILDCDYHDGGWYPKH